MIKLTRQAIAVLWAGIFSGATLMALIMLGSGCQTVHGLAADIETGSRAIREGTTPYADRPVAPTTGYVVQK